MVRLSSCAAKSPHPSSCLDFQIRNISRISTSNPNIATILSTPPVNNKENITAIGSIRTVRRQGNITFVELEDGSTAESLKALVFKKPLAEGYASVRYRENMRYADHKRTNRLATGVSVAIGGLWEPAPRGAEQRYELKAEEVRILGPADETYPIQKKYHSPEYLRRIPHLRLRTPLNAVLARMRSEADYHLSRYFHNQNFVRLQPPIITSSDCEGAGEVFSVSAAPAIQPDRSDPSEHGPFFRTEKYLTVSSQLHLEAFVHEHPRVWTLSPAFRAEKSDTPRHASEFWMLEAEVRTENLQDVMDLVENVMRSLVIGLNNSSILDEIAVATKRGLRTGSKTQSNHAEDMPRLRQRWEGLLCRHWPRVKYDEAIMRLQQAVETKEAVFQYPPSWEAGLHLEHEKWIASEMGQGGPVFVTHYPQHAKPFYMLPSARSQQPRDSTKATAACFDLLLPETAEIVGGSLREHRLEALQRAMRERGMNHPAPEAVTVKREKTFRGVGRKTVPLESHRDADGSESPTPSAASGNLDWYVDLRKYGSVPHGGFGLGFDRLLAYLAGINNIKDVMPWPRYYGRCEC
ncbi:MAG: hypothetical protein Q9163_005688 [Psora crenata]